MKLILIGDFHGKFKGIKKQHLNNCSAVISCGDFCGSFSRMLQFKILEIKKKDPKSKLKWYDLIGKKKAAKMIAKELKTGRKILEKLNKLKIPIFIVPGNADYYKKDHGWKKESKNYFEKSLIKNLKNIYNCHNKLAKTNLFNIVGYGISSGPEIPLIKKDERKYTKKKLLKEKRNYKNQLKILNNLFKKSKKTTIFLSHNVPHNTKIDKITWKKSPAYGKHLGSLITRKIIEKFGKKILFCVAGHMHEHFTKTKLKGITCINSGPGYKGKYVVIEIKDNKIKKIRFIV